MSYPHKSFRQKYSVFSAAFWQGNGNPYDLEKSDKIVLPSSALTALTECNASFTILLKIQRIDPSTNSHVIDYSAPEGLIYMASWMIIKLNLNLSGESVVELSLPQQRIIYYINVQQLMLLNFNLIILI